MLLLQLMWHWLDWTSYTRQGLSDAAGTASFIVWLFAQSPQLYENYARASVDGLSPIFLAQWMAGDITNLVGCLLTHQLPFQIAVATYFCLVDSAICAQYIYYTRIRPTPHQIPRVSRYASSITALSTADLRSTPGSPHSTRGSIPAAFFSPSLRRTTSTSSGSSSVASSSHHTRTATANATANGGGGKQSPSASTSLLGRSSSWREVASSSGYASVSASGHSVAEYAALRRAAVEEHARLLEAAAAAAAGAGGGVGSGGRKRTSRTTGSSARRRGPHFEPVNLSPTRERSGSAETRDAATTSSSTAAGDRGAMPESTMSDSFLSESSEAEADVTERFGYGFATASASASLASGALESSGVLSEGARSESLDASVTSSAAPRSTSASGSGSGGSGSSSPSRGRGMARTAERIEAARSYDAEQAGSSAFTVRQPVASTSTATAAGGGGEGQAKSYFYAEHQSQAPTRSPLVTSSPLVRQEEEEEEVPRRRGGKKRAGAALVGLGTMLGLGGSGGASALARNDTQAVGQATWTHVRHPALLYANFTAQVEAWSFAPSLSMQREWEGQLTYVVAPAHLRTFTPDETEPEPKPRPRRPHAVPTASERRTRFIGRLFAWACCLFYMTSRVPQILSNHVRRSVEGLSILLFIAAALGNTLYTLSVLINPRAAGVHRAAYLRESLPFLLGSGGTLIFDAVIVAQWLVWRKRAPMALSEVNDDEDIVSLLEETLTHPPSAPEPGAWSARPSFSRRSSVASALEDVERRARSASRPRKAVDTLRRSTSAFGALAQSGRRARTQSHDVVIAAAQREEAQDGKTKKRERPKSATLEGARTARWPRHTPLERIDTQEAT